MIVIIRSLHKVYRNLISPFFGERCRFHPSCSDYAVEAIETHGFFTGTYLTLRRLIRCQPWCAGGIDPVPSKNCRNHAHTS